MDFLEFLWQKRGNQHHGSAVCLLFPAFVLFQEDEKDGEDEAEECGEMVPLQGLVLEHEGDDDSEDGEGDDFLDDLQLHEGERAAVFDEAYPVGRHLGAVFEEGHSPGEEDDKDEGPSGGDFHFLQLEMAVPCEGHEYVGGDQKEDCT